MCCGRSSARSNETAIVQDHKLESERMAGGFWRPGVELHWTLKESGGIME